MNNFPVAVMDLFCGLFGVIFALFLLSILLINSENTELKKPEIRCEYLVKISWKEIGSDVDVWAKRTNGSNQEVCSYASREVGTFILHNDHTSASYRTIDSTELTQASETLEISGKNDGIYQFSLHPFSLRSSPEVTCKVTVEQTNPYKILFSDEVTVSKSPILEVPFLQFTLKNEEMVSIKTDPDLLETILPRRKPWYYLQVFYFYAS